jgi:single-strand selective monofunctional uracil DNA glycosylase
VNNPTTDRAGALLSAARTLSRACDAMSFSEPVAHVYNPLGYAWRAFEQYVRRYGDTPKRVIFLGMNPGPFGMMQTGVPFGEIAAVRDWLGITAEVSAPSHEHPKRRIEGFACQRSEVSGRRLWGWAAERFGSAQSFFAENFVLNYCPLVFLEASGRNYTPDKLPAQTARALEAICDAHLAENLRILRPAWAVGVGAFAAKRLHAVIIANGLEGTVRVAQILHPSPASPVANRGWAPAVEKSLIEQRVFDWRVK